MRQKYAALLLTITVLTAGALLQWKLDSDAPTTEAPVLGKWKQRFELTRDRWEYDMMFLRNPYTGEIPRDAREKDLAFVASAPRRKAVDDVDFVSRGPGNIGGRTRAVAYDISDPTGNTMLAGGVTSGVFRTTDGGQSWTKTTGANDIHSVTSIAQDPTNPQVWYYGTGEILGFRGRWGDGVWKSTDGGLSWNQLASTASPLVETIDNAWDLIHDIEINPANGDVYVAAHRNVFRSSDGGATWEDTLPTQTAISVLDGISDIEINQDGSVFYVAMHGQMSDGLGGVYRSTTGAPGSWTKLAGAGLTNPEGWAADEDVRRMVIAIAPSQENLLYVLYGNSHSNQCDDPDVEEKPEADLWRFDSSDSSWTNLTDGLPRTGNCSTGNNPFAIQGGYDMAVAVSPEDPNLVVVGGTNIYRSTDGFATEANTTRIGGYASPDNYALYRNHHPDIHSLLFSPFNSEILVSGTDGGVHSTFIDDTFPSWTSWNNGYTTLQFYHVAQSNQAGDDRVIGGSQDNGTTLGFEGADHQMIFGGDGVSVGIGDNVETNGRDAELYYMGAQFGVMWRLNTVSGYEDIKPDGSGDGIFVTLFHLDPDNTEFLYYADDNKLYRTGTASSASTSSGWTELTGIETAVGSTQGNNNTEIPNQILAMDTTRGAYGPSSKLYFGTNAGQVFRLDDPQGSAEDAAPVDISPEPQLAQPGVVISCISVDPVDDRIVLVSMSNYGIPGLWLTRDAGATWEQVQGNLDQPAKRCAAIASINGKRTYFAGTTAGLWATDRIDGVNTVWTQIGVGSLQTPFVYDLNFRTSDNRLLVGTYGNGAYVADLADGPQQYILPEVIADGNGADTYIGLVNSSDDTISVDLFGLDDAGQVVGLSSAVDDIPANGSQRILLSQAFPDNFQQVRWLRVNTSAELDVYAEHSDSVTRSAYFASRSGSDILMPHIAINTTLFETVLSTVNAETEDADCTLSVPPLNSSFPLTGVNSSFGRESRPITDYLGSDLQGGPPLWAQINCDSGNLAAMEYFTRLPDRAQRAALGLDNQRGKTLNFLHVATDTGQFWTGMVYINIGQGQANITETFYDAAGAVLGTVDQTLQSGEKRTLLFDFQDLGQVPAGTAWVQITGDQDLMGYELFGTPSISDNDTFTGLQGNYGGGRELSYPFFVSDETWFTGIVAVNLGEFTSNITFEAYGSDGVLIESVTVPDVAPKTKLVRLLRDLFTNPDALANGAWVRARGAGSEWAGFMLWGDQIGNRQFMSGLNANILE